MKTTGEVYPSACQLTTLGQNLLNPTHSTFDATTYTYNDANQVQTAVDQNGKTSFIYYPDGMLGFQKYQPVNNVNSASTIGYSYDAADRLSKVVNALTNQTTNYTYDGLSHRVAMYASLNAQSTFTTYLVDPTGSLPQALAEYSNAAGTSPTYYIPAGTLIGQDNGGTTGLSYFATDGLGSVRATFNSSGSQTGLISYEPYGKPLPDPIEPGVASHLGYSGALTDANGLIYLNARYYNPGDGQFLSSDPLAGKPADPGSFNLYGYVQGNPITLTDPSGKSALCLLPVVIPGAGWGAALACFAAEAVVAGVVISAVAVSVQDKLPAANDVFSNLKQWAQNTITWENVNKGANYISSFFNGSSTSNTPANGDGSSGSSSGGSQGAPPPCSNSFSSDTLVATDHGEVAISSLKVGDHVLAYNEHSMKVELEVIDAVLVHLDPVTELLTIDNATIHTTPNHPFYTQDKGWVVVGNLTLGEPILKADGSYGKVEAVKLIDSLQMMYNLTVQHDHTFFVGKGMWLVHNEPGFCLPSGITVPDNGLTPLPSGLPGSVIFEDTNGARYYIPESGLKHIAQLITGSAKMSITDALKVLQSQLQDALSQPYQYNKIICTAAGWGVIVSASRGPGMLPAIVHIQPKQDGC